VTGAADVFEGPAGFAAATGTTTQWARSLDVDDATLAIEQITVKPFPCCGHTFAAIDAAAQLRDARIDPAEVTEIIVATYATAIATAGIVAPRADAERRFSIQYQVAAALVFGTSQMFGAVAAADPTVRRLTAAVRLVVSDEHDVRFPAHRGATMRVVLADGTVRVIDVPDRPGSPERPLDDARLAEKFATTSAPVLGDDAESAYAALLALEAGAPIAAMAVDRAGVVSGR
jgi:2-methylcitrate dehydratase PrpD